MNGWVAEARGWPGNLMICRFVVAAGVVMLAACDTSSPDRPSAASASDLDTTTSSTSAPRLTTPATKTTVTDPTVAQPPTTTATPPDAAITTTATIDETTTSVSVGGPLEFVDGKFLGIAQGSRLPDVALILGVTPVRMSELAPEDVPFACASTADPSVIRTGGLSLVFEDVSADSLRLTNWTYSGGPIAGYEELVAPHGVRVGDTRQDLTTAYGGFQDDFGDVVDVYQPVHLRFALEGDTITWFGIIDCGD